MRHVNAIVGCNGSGKTHYLISKEIENCTSIYDNIYDEDNIDDNANMEALIHGEERLVYVGVDRINFRANKIKLLPLKETVYFENTSVNDFVELMMIMKNFNISDDKSDYLSFKKERLNLALEYLFYSDKYLDSLILAIDGIFNYDQEEFSISSKIEEIRQNYINHEKNPIFRNVSQLNDGVISVLSIYAVLVFEIEFYKISFWKERGFVCNNHFENVGKICIDEYENHLYPNVQVAFLEFLLETFPNVEITISTHSPIAVTYLNNTNVYQITNREVEEIESSSSKFDFLSSNLVTMFNFKYFDSHIQNLFSWFDIVVSGSNTEYVNNLDFSTCISIVKKEYPKYYNDLLDIINSMYRVYCHNNQKQFYEKKRIKVKGK